MILSHTKLSLLTTKLMPTCNVYGKPMRCLHSKEAKKLERAKGTLAIPNDDCYTQRPPNVS